MSVFELENNLNNRIFLKQFAELEDRYDAQFYLEGFDFTGFQKLSSLINIKGGKRIPKGMTYSSDDTNYLYLRVSDINDNSIFNYNGLKKIDQKVFDILERYEVFNDELIISIAGTVGKVALVNNIPEDYRVILTENCAKLLIRSNVKLIPKFLELLLNTNLLQKQIALNYIQTTIPKLGLDRISSLRVPNLTTLERQREIIFRFNQISEKAKNKLHQAQSLLNSIDDYLLSALGITLPEVDNGLDSRIFETSFREVSGGRFDPFYLLYCIDTPISEKYKEFPLKSIASVVKGQSITSANVIEGDYPVIAGGQTSPYSHNCYNYEGNVITVSASGAYSGYVWYHRTPIFASDCSVVQSKNEQEVTTEFIFNVLKLKQREIYNLQQGSGQPHVYPSDIERIKIPVPPLAKQNEIAIHIQGLRTQAKQLEAEAEAAMEAAKAEVERMILGE